MDLLTIRGAAERLGIAPQTLMNWRTRGYGPPSALIGGRVRYRAADIDAWIDDRFKENTNG
jgi:predicted DNA-binding transcriptional regulator AlpA